MASIEPVISRLDLPPGALGPGPASIDVRCFVVPHAAGIVLVDAGPPDSSDGIRAALARCGATWSDVTDIVLTHAHFDHVGGLADAARRAPSARLWAGAGDLREIGLGGTTRAEPVKEGDRVRDLRVLDTPGHTAGHISLLHGEAAILLIGDLIGSVDGVLSPGPEMFTADPRRSRRSLARVVELQADRIMFSHGPEIEDPNVAIAEYLAR